MELSQIGIIISLIIASLSVFVSFLSFLLSGITFVLAHLRGPNIEVASPGKTFPCISADVKNFLAEIEEVDNNPHLYSRVQTPILIMNNGNRAGILFSMKVDSNDKVYVTHKWDNIKQSLPTVILPGNVWEARLMVFVLKDQIGSRETVDVVVSTNVSASLGGTTIKQKTVNIDLKPLIQAIAKE